MVSHLYAVVSGWVELSYCRGSANPYVQQAQSGCGVISLTRLPLPDTCKTPSVISLNEYQQYLQELFPPSSRRI